MRDLQRILLITLTLLLLTSAAFATDKYAGDCTLGTTVSSPCPQTVLVGHESIAMMITPSDCGCGGATGVRVVEIHFRADGVHPNFHVQYGLREAVDSGGGCFYPGPRIWWDINNQLVPVDGPTDLTITTVDMPCLGAGESYFLEIDMEDGQNGTNFQVIGNSNPNADPCRSWYSTGVEFMVMPDPGCELAIWADVDCCDQPVATENTTWETLKVLYR